MEIKDTMKEESQARQSQIAFSREQKKCKRHIEQTGNQKIET
jgi:hypothetical protein